MFLLWTPTISSYYQLIVYELIVYEPSDDHNGSCLTPERTGACKGCQTDESYHRNPVIESCHRILSENSPVHRCLSASIWNSRASRIDASSMWKPSVDKEDCCRKRAFEQEETFANVFSTSPTKFRWTSGIIRWNAQNSSPTFRNYQLCISALESL